MSPQIDVDEELFDYLKDNAEPFVDTPNTVLRRLLGLDESELEPAEAPDLLRAETEPRSKPRRRRAQRTASKKRRAPRGVLLPETEYELPILRALAEQPQGRAPAREVITMIEPAVRDKLTDLDFQSITSGEVRWHNRAQFARLNLVKLGQLAADAPRGIWAITDAGRDRIKNER